VASTRAWMGRVQMATGHKEADFEALIEAYLLEHGGWQKGDAAAFDAATALTKDDLFGFIQATQQETWEELHKYHQSGLETAILDRLTKTLEQRGSLDVIRHGFKLHGKQIDVAYFKPAHSMNPDTLDRYEKNRLVVTRQVKFIPGKDDSIDMLLSLNGLPVATVELKNQLTGQNVEDAIKQYKARNPKWPLFGFRKRAVVHFAVGPERVAMATRLAGKDTVFLPFNRGHAGGAGNPPSESSGFRTAYLWQEVWAGDSFLDILGRFVHLQKKETTTPEGEKVTKETLIFPRYHQLDCVRRLIAASREEGPGHNYLVQHSAGSGKSNSIAWLAHRLASLHDVQDGKVFSSVVVVTDRRVLDKQLQDTIYQFEHKAGVVDCIDKKSTQLADALTKGTPIVVTTLQKFPYVTDKIGQLPDRRYAVIVDEAHSSQTGEAAREMKEVLGVAAEEALAQAQADESGEPATYEDEILKVMHSRGRQPNLSFFAFTATPKAKTLEAFGRRGADGKPLPFHLYSMRQAIEEGFILDVLKHYTTYKTYYRLVKAVEDDPHVDKKKAAKSLARFMSLHPHNIAQKTEVMVEHFRQKVRHRIGGRAKAMLVTSSRLHAVKYKLAFDDYIKAQGYTDIGTLVAFSGTVTDETGGKWTEPEMNQQPSGKPLPERELPDKFASGEYQVLLVANKYQTGFDQPLLHTMYVDKRLSGVHAVQTLSRLNRTRAGKEDTFVLDFVNSAADIQEAFQPFYEATTVAETAEPHHLYDLQDKLDAAQIYLRSEVDALAKVFYAPKSASKKGAIDHLYKYLEPARDRFQAAEEAAREAFRKTLQSYVRLYSFVARIMPFTDADLEKLYTFGRFLLLRLPRPDDGDPLDLGEEVALKYYRLEKVQEQAIQLMVGEPGIVYGPVDVGTGRSKGEKAALSEIIEVLNERFGTEFSEADQLFFDQLTAQAKAEPDVAEKAHANSYDNFSVWMRKKMQDVMAERVDENAEIVARYLDDSEFQQVLFNLLARRVYDELRG